MSSSEGVVYKCYVACFGLIFFRAAASGFLPARSMLRVLFFVFGPLLVSLTSMTSMQTSDSIRGSVEHATSILWNLWSR